MKFNLSKKVVVLFLSAASLLQESEGLKIFKEATKNLNNPWINFLFTCKGNFFKIQSESSSQNLQYGTRMQM